MAIAKDLCAELMSVDAATITELVDALDGARAEIARLTERYGTPHTAVIGARIDTILAKVRSQ